MVHQGGKVALRSLVGFKTRVEEDRKTKTQFYSKIFV